MAIFIISRRFAHLFKWASSGLYKIRRGYTRFDEGRGN